MSDFFSTTEEAREWFLSFFAAMDSLSTSRLPQFFANDARLQFGNNDEITGVEQITSYLGARFEGFESIKHRLIETDVMATKTLNKCTVTYVLRGDPEFKKITVPAFVEMRLRAVSKEDGANEGATAMIAGFQAWLDGSPLVERVKELGELK